MKKNRLTASLICALVLILGVVPAFCEKVYLGSAYELPENPDLRPDALHMKSDCLTHRNLEDGGVKTGTTLLNANRTLK